MKAKLIEVSDGHDYACGACFSILYSDEEICPSCGAIIRIDLPVIKMTQSELENAYANKENAK